MEKRPPGARKERSRLKIDRGGFFAVVLRFEVLSAQFQHHGVPAEDPADAESSLDLIPAALRADDFGCFVAEAADDFGALVGVRRAAHVVAAAQIDKLPVPFGLRRAQIRPGLLEPGVQRRDLFVAFRVPGGQIPDLFILGGADRRQLH